MVIRYLLLSFVLLNFFGPIAQAQQSARDDVAVSVHFDGDIVVVDASFNVAVTPQEAWAVLTDFDHLAKFISNLQSSTVLSRTGDTLRVAQKGKASMGPLSFSFDQVREITLTPYEAIHSRMVSGSMKKFEGTTRLVPDASNTHVVYHSESIPNVWVPPILGRAFIERETRAQFLEFRSEMLRRKQAADAK